MTSTQTRLNSALANRYRVDRELGAGGMATVYLAHDIKHDRDVAIKVLHPELGAALGGDRFLTEIRTTARLQHPHILPLLDSGEAGGLLYYVMPLVTGETLRARLERERQLPIGQAVLIAREVADALQYAHAQNVIHRDIKPENILLQGGHALVADFGIALAVQSAGGARMTQTGLSLGTPSYMSPEQAMGERTIDARSDIYALGAVTYEMLTGEPPFTGATMQAIVAKVMSAEPERPSLTRKTLPPNVEFAVLHALAKLPADRYATAAEFSSALTDTHTQLHAASFNAAPARSSASRYTPWIAGIFAGALLGVAGAMFMQRNEPQTPIAPARFLITSPDSVELQAVCCGQMFTLSPDGGTLVYQGRRLLADSSNALSTTYALYARPLDDVSAHLIPGTENAQSISFSPDGKQLAFFVGQRLMRIPVAGGAPTQVATLARGYVGGSSWISNSRIVTAVGAKLYEADVNADSARVLFTLADVGRQTTAPFFVKEGNAVLFSDVSRSTAPVVHWLSLDAKTEKVLVSGATPTYVASWRKLVVARGTQLIAYPFDPVKGDTLGPGVRISDGIFLRSPVMAHGEFAISANGTLVQTRRVTDADRAIKASMITGAPDHSTLTPIVFPEKETIIDHPRFTPDGRRFVVEALDDVSNRSMYIFNLDRSLSQRIAAESDAALPNWTTQGDSIIYYGLKSQQFRIVAADGGGQGRVLNTPARWTTTTNFSVNGAWLALEGRPDGENASTDITLFNRDSGGAVRPLAATEAEETDPAISPDGKWIAFTSDETGRQEVYVTTFPNPTAKFPVSTGGGRFPVWSGDGKTISFDGAANGFTSLAFTPGTPPVFGKPRLLYRRSFVRSWAISPDGTRLLFIDTVRLLKLLGLELSLQARN